MTDPKLKAVLPADGSTLTGGNTGFDIAPSSPNTQSLLPVTPPKAPTTPDDESDE